MHERIQHQTGHGRHAPDPRPTSSIPVRLLIDGRRREKVHQNLDVTTSEDHQVVLITPHFIMYELGSESVTLLRAALAEHDELAKGRRSS